MQVTSAQIVVLATGGTIAGAASRPGDHLGYRAGQLGVQELLAGVPGLDTDGVAAEQVANIDSKDMDWSVWRPLAARCAHWLGQPGLRGIVVTHGTDTLEETAWFLQRVLVPARPVVLASAMRPATAPSPDGPQNLLDAIEVARTPGAAGVMAVCAGVVHAAADVRKVHPYRLDAFGSGDAGPVARVEAGEVRRLRDWPREEAARDLLRKVLESGRAPWVEVVHSHAGADGRLVDALVERGIEGIVVAATGNGTVHAALEAALLGALARGVRVVRSTRCTEGRVIAQPPDRIPATPLTPAKARVDLQLDLLGG